MIRHAARSPADRTLARRACWSLAVGCGALLVVAAFCRPALADEAAGATDAEIAPVGSILASPEGAPPDLDAPDLDVLVTEAVGATDQAIEIDHERFLRRATLDLLGRQPTPAERTDYLADQRPDRRAHLIDRLLADEAFGRNWANYWTDVIRFRVPPPELTYLDYEPLKTWLAEQLNTGAPWDDVVRRMLTAQGVVSEQPESTFIGYHQGSPEKLAAETARIFLGVQIQCAECHDHPFDDWRRRDFHELAAFFARAEVKLPQLASLGTEVKSKDKGEYRMPDAHDPSLPGEVITPAFLTADAIPAEAADAERRDVLARLVTDPENRWFARAFVNRAWARLMGRGFFEPVDNIDDDQDSMLPDVHRELAAHFIATGHDVKNLLRLVMTSDAYARQSTDEERWPVKLRGDEVFDSLVAALALPNQVPPPTAPTDAIRFPPPPESTRDVVAKAFAYDPSLACDEISRTLGQAMLLMNNEQVQAQIDASPDADTVLGNLLSAVDDDRLVVDRLFTLVLARQPTEREAEIALAHVDRLGARGEGFEDLLWSLLNTTEFTLRP